MSDIDESLARVTRIITIIVLAFWLLVALNLAGIV